MLHDTFSVETCDRLASVLLHSLWQGAVLAVLVWLSLRLLPGQSAKLRYSVCAAGLLGVVLAAFSSWSWFAPVAPAADSVAAVEAAVQPEVGHDVVPDKNGEHAGDSSPSGLTATESSASTDQSWSSYLVLIWAFGAAGMLLRVCRSARASDRLIATHADVDVERQSDIRAVIDSLCNQLRIRHAVRLIVTGEVDTPGVIGIMWPTLLIPASMVTGVPVEEWRVILAHELAHMRRHDYLVNLLQMLVEAALFFNPAVWWISRQMRIEREACCDRVAAEIAGQPLDVARTLVRVAERLQNAPAASPVPMLAMSGDNQPGSLFDRVRRLVTPGERPSVAMPWLSLLGFAIVATLVFAGLQQGTDLAVQAAKEAMSPADRVQQIVDLNEHHGELGRAEQNADPENLLLDPSLSGKVELSGTIRMEDGSPVPARTAVFSVTSARITENNSRSSTGLGTSNADPVDVFEWAGTVNRGLTIVYVRPPKDHMARFAPTALRAIPANSPEKVSGLDLVLTTGFTAQLRVADPDGQPISEASVLTRFRIGTDSSASWYRPQTLTTDTNGLITIPHASDTVPLACEARVDGFEMADTRLMLKPDEVVEWRLTRTRSFSASVVADATGEPITGARVHLIEESTRSSGHHHVHHFDDPRDEWNPDKGLAAESDAQGKFELSTLRNSPEYTLWIEAEGFGPQLVPGVKAGDAGTQVRLKPPIVVSGRITGNIESLPLWKKKQINYRNPLPSYDDILRTDIEVRDGAAYFRLDRLLSGRPLRLFLGDRTFKFDVQESVIDIEINLDEPPRPVANAVLETKGPQGPTRRVVVKLSGDRPDAPVSGDIQFGYKRRDGRSTSQTLSIENGQVEFDIEVPTNLSIYPRRLLGYWAAQPKRLSVGESTEPLEIDVKLHPAGAIHGTVHESDGSLSDNFLARLHVLSMPPGMDAHARHQIENDPTKASRGEFLFTSLPTGGSYGVVVRRERGQSLFAASTESIELQPENPIRTHDFRFRDGADYSGRILNQAGQPIPGGAVRVSHKIGAMGESSSGYAANESGTIELHDARSDAPHEYTLEFYAPGHIGQVYKVKNWNNVPREFRLLPGKLLRVSLIHADTGEPLPNYHCFTLPSGEFTSRTWPSGRTSDTGRISFDTFEPIEYSLRIPRVIVKSISVEEGDSTGARLHSDFSDNAPTIRFVAGKATSIIVRAVPE